MCLCGVSCRTTHILLKELLLSLLLFQPLHIRDGNFTFAYENVTTSTSTFFKRISVFITIFSCSHLCLNICLQSILRPILRYKTAKRASLVSLKEVLRNMSATRSQHFNGLIITSIILEKQIKF